MYDLRCKSDINVRCVGKGDEWDENKLYKCVKLSKSKSKYIF